MKNLLHIFVSLVLISCAAEEELTLSHLNPNLTYGSVTDCSGNTYATIDIGGQEWMAENLRTTCYASGAPIPNVTDNTEWSNLNTGAWCHYENDNLYETPYGKLYNWYAVNDSRNVCPIGWHVPTDDEWNTMIGYLDPNFSPFPVGSEVDMGSYTRQSEIAGGKMKSVGSQYWFAPHLDATNESGFSGLPGVHTYAGGNLVGRYGYWWTSTQVVPGRGWCRYLHWANSEVHRSSGTSDGVGLSIRCIKD